MNYVYKITNLTNGKVYIGVSVDPAKRFRCHSQRGHSFVSRAIQKHGVGTFALEILSSHIERTDAFFEEIRQIQTHKSNQETFGYNLTPGGEDPPSSKGQKRTQRTKDRISQAHKGKVLSLAHRQKLSASLSGNQNSQGHVCTKEMRQHWSQQSQGRRLSDQTKAMLSEIGRKNWSDQTYKGPALARMQAAKRQKAASLPTPEQRLIAVLKNKGPLPTLRARSEVAAKNEHFYEAMRSLIAKKRLVRVRVSHTTYLHLSEQET